jgi:prepilin-type processing-associated H-X9-DG protein
MSNCRQLAQATLLYRSDYNDAFPFGVRVSYGSQVLDPAGWPMQLLRYIGGGTNSQPSVFMCPNEKGIAYSWPLQLHYQANRLILSDTNDRDTPITGAQVRKPCIYWLFMEKGPYDYANARPGSLAVVLASWNVPPGSSSYRRHSGGATAAAADGHTEWLRPPPYEPGRPPPQNFGELGDCADGQNPASGWTGSYGYIKLYCRYSVSGF